jgi:hypothetical protein
MNYEQGLRALEQHVPANDVQARRDMELFQAQLHENLRDEGRFGDSENLRAERWRIVDRLNMLALRVSGQSFTDLCADVEAATPPAGETAEATLAPDSPTTDVTTPEAVVSLTFQPSGDAVAIAWRSPLLGERTTAFVPPYDAAALLLVIKALDAAQWPNHPLEGPKFSSDEQAQLAALKLWQQGRVPPNSYKLVGQALYDALGAEGKAVLDTVRNDAVVRRRATNYVLRFPDNAVSLAALPWEAIADQGRPLLLARGSDVDSCERYIQSDLGLPPPLPAGEQLHILSLSPEYHIPDDVRTQERAARLASWEKLRSEGQLSFDELSPLTPRALTDYLRGAPRRPDIVHYFGHGVYRHGQGYLLFDEGAGGKSLVSAERLSSLLGDVRLLVFFACQSAMIDEEGGLLSGIAPALSMVAGGVVAMQLTVRISAATRFAEVFYDELLGRRRSVQQAVAAGRQTLFFEEQDGASWFVPTVYLRSYEPQPLLLIEP